jgi:hypothetical protein
MVVDGRRRRFGMKTGLIGSKTVVIPRRGGHEATAGVQHHVALSIVGTDRATDNGYLRAEVAQEKLVEASGIPYTTIRSTQFLESSAASPTSPARNGHRSTTSSPATWRRSATRVRSSVTPRPDTSVAGSRSARSCRWAKRAPAGSVSTNGSAVHGPIILGGMAPAPRRHTRPAPLDHSLT